MNKIVLENSEQAIVSVSNSIIALAKQSIIDSGKFIIALSGGNTPKLLYQYLISDNRFQQLDCTKIQVYFSDERYVGHDDDRSNYGLAVKYLLSKVNIPDNNIYPVNTSFNNVDDSAKNYQKIIQENINNKNKDIPVFDLIILGIGTDGHTASLFPESKLLSDQTSLVGSCFHPGTQTNRVTFTFRLINAAKNVFIIALGSEKFHVLDEIQKFDLKGAIKYPVQQVKPDGNLVWYLDKAAEQGV